MLLKNYGVQFSFNPTLFFSCVRLSGFVVPRAPPLPPSSFPTLRGRVHTTTTVVGMFRLQIVRDTTSCHVPEPP